MTPGERASELTTLHWIVLGLVSTWRFGPPERLASEMGIALADVESLCQDLERLGWIRRVGLH